MVLFEERRGRRVPGRINGAVAAGRSLTQPIPIPCMQHPPPTITPTLPHTSKDLSTLTTELPAPSANSPASPPTPFTLLQCARTCVKPAALRNFLGAYTSISL